MSGPIANVPCNGCTACCRNQVVVLFPEHGDDLTILSRHIDLGGAVILMDAENGDCIYLENGKCSVYEHRPAMCRAFDCRDMFRSLSRAQRRRMVRDGTGSEEIFDAGRARLHTLGDSL